MRRYFVDKTCINLIRLVLLLLTALLDGLFYYCIPAVPYLSDLPAIMWTVIGLVTAAGLFAAMVYLPLYFRHTCYYISSEQVIKHSGCFFVRTQTQRHSVYHGDFHTLFQDYRAELSDAECIRRLHAAALSEQAGF